MDTCIWMAFDKHRWITAYELVKNALNEDVIVEFTNRLAEIQTKCRLAGTKDDAASKRLLDQQKAVLAVDCMTNWFPYLKEKQKWPVCRRWCWPLLGCRIFLTRKDLLMV